MNIEELQLKFHENKNSDKTLKKEINKFDYVTPFVASLPLNNESRPAVLYMRISTQYQQNDGYSLEHQDSTLTKYCLNNNLYIVDKFVEVISGGTMERPELQRMLESLKPGYCVVCNAVSRLSRNLEDLFEIDKRIKQSKATLILLDIAVDTSTTNGKLILTMMGSVSEIERAQISERVSNVMQYLKSEKKLKTKPHYGWKRTPDGLEKKEDEQAVIDVIRLLVKNEPDITSGKISRLLNNKGFTNRNNKKFHISTIESIIKHNNIPYKYFKNNESTVDIETINNKVAEIKNIGTLQQPLQNIPLQPLQQNIPLQPLHNNLQYPYYNPYQNYNYQPNYYPHGYYSYPNYQYDGNAQNTNIQNNTNIHTNGNIQNNESIKF